MHGETVKKKKNDAFVLKQEILSRHQPACFLLQNVIAHCNHHYAYFRFILLFIIICYHHYLRTDAVYTTLAWFTSRTVITFII